MLLCSVQSGAQDKGTWRAASTTARGITGDVTFLNEKIAINFNSFPVAQIRSIEPSEASAAFNAENSSEGSGNLYRMSIPAEKKFLHHNTICGSDDTQWMVTYTSGRNLSLAFFSGEKMPVLTLDSLANATNLCGTFSYTR